MRRQGLNVGCCFNVAQEDYEECITACSEVLSEDKQNAKALFRRGRARFLLGQSEGALKDLEAAQAAAPHDGGIARELAAVRKAIKEVRQDCMGRFIHVGS
jgi:tetratricopeptide (TPR) repeat protein